MLCSSHFVCHSRLGIVLPWLGFDSSYARTLFVSLRSLSIASFILACLVGVMFGVGGYTFVYAKGFSYLSSNPAACANCHIMQSQYDGWHKSGHHHVAGCADCHMPASFFAKYLTKAENGYLHSKAFTLQNFHEPIIMRDKSKTILNRACVHCHESIVHNIVLPTSDERDMCTRCHSGVGH